MGWLGRRGMNGMAGEEEGHEWDGWGGHEWDGWGGGGA